MINIAIASDHAGHEIKDFLKRKLKADYNMVDFGTFFKEVAACIYRIMPIFVLD